MIWLLTPFRNAEPPWRRRARELSSLSAGVATGLLFVLLMNGRLNAWLGLAPDLIGTAETLTAFFLAQGAVLWAAFRIGFSGLDRRTATNADVAGWMRPVVDRWVFGGSLVPLTWSLWNLAVGGLRQYFFLITVLAFSFTGILALEPISRRIWHMPPAD